MDVCSHFTQQLKPFFQFQIFTNMNNFIKISNIERIYAKYILVYVVTIETYPKYITK